MTVVLVDARYYGDIMRQTGGGGHALHDGGWGNHE